MTPPTVSDKIKLNTGPKPRVTLIDQHIIMRFLLSAHANPSLITFQAKSSFLCLLVKLQTYKAAVTVETDLLVPLPIGLVS